MIKMLDYSKYSVLEYNQILLDWFNGNPPVSPDIFTHKVHHIKRSVDDKTLLIIFENNQWLKVDKKGWWCEKYCDDTRDVISNRHFYQKDRTSESLGLGHIAYTSRPSKGITYKNMIVNGLDVSRNDNRVNLSIYHKYLFNVQHFKKYKEYQFNTHCGMFYFEKVNSKNEVLKTSIRVTKGKETYSMLLEWHKDRKRVMIELVKNFSREKRLEMPFKDCSIDNIFNKYIMFEFELMCEQKDFDVIENVRTLMKEHVLNTYTKLKEEGLNADLVGQVLKRIEVIESDEHQVQRRP